MRRIASMLVLAAVALLPAKAAPPLPMAFGVTYNRSIKSHQNGLGFKLVTDLGKRVRIEPEMIYFAAHDDVTALHLNINLHWRMPLFDSFTFYPLVGLSYTHWGYEGPNANRWGANLGAGAEFQFMRQLSAFTEARVLFVSHETQPIYNVGLKYHFR